MSTDSIAAPQQPGTSALSGTLSLTVGIACNVEKASPFDRMRAEEARRKAARPAQKWAKDRAKRTPRQKAPRLDLFKTPVNVPAEVGNYRAKLCAHARWLPPHLASVMIGAVCASDVSGEPVHTSHEAISAYTHTPGIRQRYKCKPVSPFQVEYNLPTLATMGLVTTSSRKYYDSWDRRFKTEFLLEITDENIENLEACYTEGVAAKAARDAEKAERKAATDARRNRYKREKRARQMVVEDESSYYRHTADPESSTESSTESGTESGTGHIANANQVVPGQVVPNQDLRNPSSDPGCARDDDLLNALEDRGGDPHTPQDSDEEDPDVAIDDMDKMIIARSLGVPVSTVGPSFWDWFAGEYDRARNGGMEEERVFYRATDLAAEVAVGGRNPVGMFRTALPQKVAHVSHKLAAESWAGSDDAVVYWTWMRIFDDNFMPDAETFTAEDVSRKLNVTPKLAARALDYLVRGCTATGWLTWEDGQYTRHFFDARKVEERAKREAAAAAEKAAKKAEREAAKAEFDRLMPEFEGLVAAYEVGSSRSELPNELRILGQERDPRDKLRLLQEKIDWYRNDLAERDRRAPLVPLAVEYVRQNPGTSVEAIAAAIGADPDDVGDVVDDDIRARSDVPNIRREWGWDATTERWRAHYYIQEGTK